MLHARNFLTFQSQPSHSINLDNPVFNQLQLNIDSRETKYSQKCYIVFVHDRLKIENEGGNASVLQNSTIYR